MAALSNEDRQELWTNFMRVVCARNENLSSGGAMTKQQLRAAVDAVDQWVSDNKTAFNNAIPDPAKTALSADQKAELLVYIVKKRWEVGI
jgi:hypothetical protein